MDKTARAKYLLAVYLVVGALGVISILLSLVFQWPDPWQSISINLGTGLISVVVLFFLVDRFFLADDERISDTIDRLIRRIETSDQPPAELFFVKPPELDEYIGSAVAIDLCGVTLTNTINDNFAAIRERLRNGASVRVLVSSPDSLALEMSALRSREPDKVDYYTKRLDSTFTDIGFLSKAAADVQRDDQVEPGKSGLSVGLLSYAPSFSILRFAPSVGNGTIVVELYPHHGGYLPKPVFILRPERDKLWYEYFSTQFDQMWASATPWDPETPPEELAQLLRRRTGIVPARNFLSTERYLPERLLKNAKRIYMSGYTLAGISRLLAPFLERCLQAGGHVRIMILEATDELMSECVKTDAAKGTPAAWRERLHTTTSRMSLIAKAARDGGLLEVGHLSVLPSCGLFLVDPDTDHGLVMVELFQYHTPESNPTFTLRRGRDGTWYEVFRREFDLMWDTCRVERLPREESKGPVASANAPASPT